MDRKRQEGGSCMRRFFIVFLLITAIIAPLSATEGEKYTLSSLITAMETGNAELLKSDQEILKAALDTKDAKGGYTPTIDLLVSGTFMANPMLGPITMDPDDIEGLPAIVGSLFTDPVTVSMDMGNNRIQGQLTLTQPIYTWGKLSNAVKLFETVESIRAMERTDKESQLIVQLKSMLDALYYMDTIFPLLDEVEAKADELIVIAESAEEAGAMLESDVLDARIQKQQTAISRKELEMQYSSVLESLRTLTGISNLTMDKISYIPDEDIADKILSYSEEELLELAVDPARLPLQMLSSMEEVQEYTGKIAKGSIYGKPDIALQVSASYGGTIKPSSWEDTWGVNITVALSTTLWDGGKKMNDIKRAESGLASASIDYDSAVRTISANVSSSYMQAFLSREKIAYAELKRDADELKAEQERTGLALGSSSQSSVLQAELAVIQDEIEAATEHITLSQSVYTLMYLTAMDPDRLPLITDGMI